MKNTPHKTDNIFAAATRWSDDRLIFLELSRKRYQIAFFSMSGLVALLILCLISLFPLKKIQLAIVHQGPSGDTWVSTLNAGEIPQSSWAQTESEIAHYVTLRESYDPVLYPYQSKQITEFSNDLVLDGYLSEQDKSNTTSPINFLSDKGYRTIIIQSVLPLDLASKNTTAETGHINLAQVIFTATDHYFSNINTNNSNNPDNPLGSARYTALVSWAYTGISSNPEIILNNWDGFVITKYQKQLMNINP